jgi:hypothetical protein
MRQLIKVIVHPFFSSQESFSSINLKITLKFLKLGLNNGIILLFYFIFFVETLIIPKDGQSCGES